MKDEILDAYKQNIKIYTAYKERVVNLLTDLLSDQEIVIHQISGRTKSLESLSKKIDEKGEKYTCIEDITDIIGIRIITYMESDVNTVSNLIEKEFMIDTQNSIDKRILKTDQFGYRSLHVVIMLNESRSNLKEYKKYKGFKCEIQIRSILQHAWAEIEHDLGYKGEISIPDQYKRTFNRLSALLETADVEFDRLKTELKEYENRVPILIKSKPENVDINAASINSFLKTNDILLEVKKLIENITGVELKPIDNYDPIMKLLRFHELKSIGDLSKMLTMNKDRFLRFAEIFINNRINKGMAPATIAPLLYFLHFLAGKSQDIERAKKHARAFGINNENFAKQYIDFYVESNKA